MGKKEKRKFKKFVDVGFGSSSNSQQAISIDVNIRKSETPSHAQAKKSITSSSYRNDEMIPHSSGPVADHNISIPEVSEELKNKLVTNCDLQNETTSQRMSGNISQGHFGTTANNRAWNSLSSSVPVAPQIQSLGHGCNPPLGHNIKPAQHNVVSHNMEPADFVNKVPAVLEQFPLESQNTNSSDIMNKGMSLNVQADAFVPRPPVENLSNQDLSDGYDQTTSVQVSSDSPDIQHEPQLQQTENSNFTEKSECPSDQQQNFNPRSFTRHSDPNYGNSRENKYKQLRDNRPYQDYSKNRNKTDRRSESGNHYDRYVTNQSSNFGPKRDGYVLNEESGTPVTEDVQEVIPNLESETDGTWSRRVKKNSKNSRSQKNYQPSSISREKDDKRGYQSGKESHKEDKQAMNYEDISCESHDKADYSTSFNSSRKSTCSSRLDTSNKDIYNRSYEKADKEYIQFEEEYKRNKNSDPVRVKEIEGDLFEMPEEYALGHCVAEDMRMGSGIAVNFKRDFKCVEDLLDQRQKQGGLAYLELNKRFIYYLVTKRESNGKPTYQTFWSSLKKMRDHITENKVKKLAIPRIGCGLDRLEWSKVSFMLEFLFRDVDVGITVCNFQQMEDSTPQKDYLSNKIVNDFKPLVEIEALTIILYSATEDGHISEEMKTLAKKFNFLPEFKKSPKQLGKPIRHVTGDYILYGCVVRKTEEALFNFSAFGKCLFEINKNNKKDLFEYVALQAVYDAKDDLLNEKIITLLRIHLKHVNIHICPANNDNEEKKQWRS